MTVPAAEDARTDTLRLLFQMNEHCLHAMAQPCERGADAGAREAWLYSDATTQARAAAFPALLLDIRGWEGSTATNGERPFFPARLALPLMRSVLTLAWHICRTERQAAGFLLGLPQESAARLGQMGPHDLERIARTRAHCLRPRWWQTPSIWTDLLIAARHADPQDFDRFKLRALQTLLGEFLPPPVTRSDRHCPPGARARNDGIPPA